MDVAGGSAVQMSGCHFATTSHDEEERQRGGGGGGKTGQAEEDDEKTRTKDEEEEEEEKEGEKLEGLRDFAGSRNKWKNGRCGRVAGGEA